MSSYLLETKNLSVGYGDKIIGRDLDFFVEPGEIVSLIGPNGSGKTTILKTVSGFIPPLKGESLLGGRKIGEVSQGERAKFMSVMMTERMAADQMTVRDMVSMGRFPYTDMLGRLSEEDRGIVESALNRVDLMEIADQVYNDLSDGQKQRTLLARAIAQEPRIMLLDEPTSYLDIYHKLKFIDILKSLAKEENIGILMSVHELEIAYEISDRIVSLGRDGLIKAQGRPEEVFGQGRVSDLYGLEEGRLAEMYGGFLSALEGAEGAEGSEARAGSAENQEEE